MTLPESVGPTQQEVEARIERAKRQVWLEMQVITTYVDGLNIEQASGRIGRSPAETEHLLAWLGLVPRANAPSPETQYMERAAAPTLPPLSLGDVPEGPHCTCMSGITAAQLKLMNLHGGLQVVEWLTVEAQHAVSGVAPVGNPTVHGHLVRLQQLLERARRFCLDCAFPQREVES